jgi:hypothetical protein
MMGSGIVVIKHIALATLQIFNITLKVIKEVFCSSWQEQ